MGASFEPYLQTIMPLVLRSAAIRADVSMIGEIALTHFVASLAYDAI